MTLLVVSAFGVHLKCKVYMWWNERVEQNSRNKNETLPRQIVAITSMKTLDSRSIL